MLICGHVIVIGLASALRTVPGVLVLRKRCYFDVAVTFSSSSCAPDLIALVRLVVAYPRPYLKPDPVVPRVSSDFKVLYVLETEGNVSCQTKFTEASTKGLASSKSKLVEASNKIDETRLALNNELK